MTEHTVSIHVISDSAGETAIKLALASIAQYRDLDIPIYRHNFISDEEELGKILHTAKEENSLILHTLISKNLNNLANNFCKENNLYCLDLLWPIVKEIGIRTQIEPSLEPGALHALDKNYFKRIDAMEFAVKYDDGKDARGFLEADIVLLGVSRTSKTPLSLYLANKNYKVANLPLIPEAHIPKEIWEVDNKKIVGLTNDLSVLNQIRKKRMIAYGLDPDTTYSDITRIEEELKFAKDLYKKIGCIEINVAKLSIEETASIIFTELGLEDHSYL